MSRSPLEYLQHIQDETSYLIEDSRTIDEDQFMRDETRKRAYARSFEIIGEASKQVDSETKEQFPNVEWKAMARMRDRLIHHYFGVDYALVWNTVKNDIPRLHEEVITAITTLSQPKPNEIERGADNTTNDG